MCRVQIPNGRWWSFILIVYRDGWKVWGWSQANICPLYGPRVMGSRIWPSAGTHIFGSRQCSNSSSAHLSQISSLEKLLYGIWRACEPFRNILGGFPWRTWCFPPSYEGGVPNLGFRDRKHSGVFTKSLYLVKYRFCMVISIICDLVPHSMAPQYATGQV